MMEIILLLLAVWFCIWVLEHAFGLDKKSLARKEAERDREREAEAQKVATAALVKEHRAAVKRGDKDARRRYLDALERNQPWAIEIAEEQSE